MTEFYSIFKQNADSDSLVYACATKTEIVSTDDLAFWDITPLHYRERYSAARDNIKAYLMGEKVTSDALDQFIAFVKSKFFALATARFSSGAIGDRLMRDNQYRAGFVANASTTYFGLFRPISDPDILSVPHLDNLVARATCAGALILPFTYLLPGWGLDISAGLYWEIVNHDRLKVRPDDPRVECWDAPTLSDALYTPRASSQGVLEVVDARLASALNMYDFPYGKTRAIIGDVSTYCASIGPTYSHDWSVDTQANLDTITVENDTILNGCGSVYVADSFSSDNFVDTVGRAVSRGSVFAFLSRHSTNHTSRGCLDLPCIDAATADILHRLGTFGMREVKIFTCAPVVLGREYENGHKFRNTWLAVHPQDAMEARGFVLWCVFPPTPTKFFLSEAVSVMRDKDLLLVPDSAPFRCLPSLHYPDVRNNYVGDLPVSLCDTVPSILMSLFGPHRIYCRDDYPCAFGCRKSPGAATTALADVPPATVPISDIIFPAQFGHVFDKYALCVSLLALMTNTDGATYFEEGLVNYNDPITRNPGLGMYYAKLFGHLDWKYNYDAPQVFDWITFSGGGRGPRPRVVLRARFYHESDDPRLSGVLQYNEYLGFYYHVPAGYEDLLPPERTVRDYVRGLVIYPFEGFGVKH